VPDIADPLILIVDDDAAHAASVRDLLAAHQYPAAAITDSTSVLHALQSHDYHVLLLDLNMPGMTGLEVLAQLQQAEIDIKTIVLSGEKQLSTVTPILRLGAYDYLAKPYEPQQLLTSIENALIQARLERDNASMAVQVQADQELHQFLLNASPDLIYMLDGQGNFRFVNSRLEEVFGFAVDDMQGRPWQSLIGSDLAPALQHRFNERRTGERATRALEFEYITRSGERRVFEFSATGLYDDPKSRDPEHFTGTYGVLRDVTDARQTARDLALSQEKFYGLFMESPDAVFISRLDSGQLIEGNDKFREIKVSLGAIDSQLDHFVFGSSDEREQFGNRLRESPQHLQYQLQRQLAGETLFFEVNARRLEIDGEPCVLATVRDRTAEHRAEMDRLLLQNQLQQASKMEAIGQLAGGIAHDFNNILASIIGYAELVQNARERLESTQIDNYLGEVVTAGHRARDLISQMLTFTRANRGEPCSVDISDAITDVSRMLRAAIPTTIDIETEFAQDLANVMADPVQLQQIIINLLINARDAIKGNGRIRIRAGRGSQSGPCVCCGERLSEEHIVLEVEDNGHGISKEMLDRIFEMYFTTREHGKGTGIGLWLIDNLVHEYAGHITVQSTPGTGTTFSIHLPVAGRVELTDPHQTPEPVELDGRILVVDDEVSVSNFIGEVLRDHGYEVVIFNESPMAMRYLETHIDEIAMILTDQMMPLMTGLELSARVKELRPALPIILITAFAANRDSRRMAEIGVDRFLAKPFRIDELLSAIRQLTLQPASAMQDPDPVTNSTADISTSVD
jgi:PAS domain S-box-containing protein